MSGKGNDRGRVYTHCEGTNQSGDSKLRGEHFHDQGDIDNSTQGV